MFRDMLSGSRAILVGLVFFVLVVGGSLLYSWHVHRTTDAEVAETQRKVQPLENKNETLTAANTVDTSRVDFGQAGTDLETDDAQMSNDTGVSPIDETSEGLDLSDAFLPDGGVSEEEIAEDVPLSPHGFGPYPEIPADYPKDLTPTWITEDGHQSRTHELVDRVLIKLWNQGDKNISGGYRSNKTGKIYPLYPNTVYVRYKEIVAPDGTVHRFIGSNSGTVTLGPSGEVPPGVTVLDLDKEGVDPYHFLDLK